jgi:phosphoenolpyruvate-protein kinase (PTS system EI component)
MNFPNSPRSESVVRSVLSRMTAAARNASSQTSNPTSNQTSNPASNDARIAAILAIEPSELSSLLHPQFAVGIGRTPITVGLPASPGAASGRVALSAEAALTMSELGNDVILVRSETTPDDVMGMQAARGILTARGGLVSHAAVVARGWGIPAVVGVAQLHIGAHSIEIGGYRFEEGDDISINGSTGEVYPGRLSVSGVDVPAELDELLGWADEVVNDRVRVRANADNASDARHARQLGARGVGLCRTEHMFLADDRLPLMRRFILTDDPAVEAQCLAELQRVQQLDFVGILEAMDGLPVTVRLLDPPLHEFLPDAEPLIAAEARGELADDGATARAARDQLAAIRRLKESNPMIGTRGVRLGVLKPGVYQMQVRALLLAVAARVRDGGSPSVEIMIPLVVEEREMALARGWVIEAMRDIGLDKAAVDAVQVGTMIETPRAALTAGDIAQRADFFSFGTNDLTQLTFAFSRDDVETRLIPSYLRSGVLEANPFDRLDTAGVGRLISIACAEGRLAKPGLKIGICGEHAGDPNSVQFLVDAGVDYLSCSPYRVPIARLAVAHAFLRIDGVDRVDGVDGADRVEEVTVTSNPLEVIAEGNAALTVEPKHRRFSVLHALRIKGFAFEPAIAALSLVPLEEVQHELAELLGEELVKHIPARSMWQLTPAGRTLHASLISSFVADSRAELRVPYDKFLAHNDRLKQLCTAWQTSPDGATNSHSDSTYDAERITDLRSFHNGIVDVLHGFASAVARFGSYYPRLSLALDRLTNGDTKAFTGVMCDSYHDIWMELHEDLIQLLGIDRSAEGSF